VLDHTGKPIVNAAVYLAGAQVLSLTNGRNDVDRGGSRFQGSKTFSNREGRFTLSGGGDAKDRLVVVSDGLAWLVQPQAGQEQRIQLPQPATVSIKYDIEGAARLGVFRLELRTWEMPEWKGVATSERLIECENGKDVTVSDLTPGEYDVCRLIERLRVGDLGRSAMCDRNLNLNIAQTATLEFVRPKGSAVSGQVLGLKEANLPGAFVQVRPESVTGNPRAKDEWKLTVFDALTTGPDGQFKTSRIAPGTYMVTAEAYGRDNGRSGWRLPSLVGKTKVVVPETGQAEPVRIELAPLSAPAR